LMTSSRFDGATKRFHKEELAERSRVGEVKMKLGEKGILHLEEGKRKLTHMDRGVKTERNSF